MKMTLSHSLDPVVNAYRHALFGRHPKYRYLIGYDAWAYFLLGLLPEWFIDKVFVLSDSLPKPQCMIK